MDDVPRRTTDVYIHVKAWKQCAHGIIAMNARCLLYNRKVLRNREFPWLHVFALHVVAHTQDQDHRRDTSVENANNDTIFK